MNDIYKILDKVLTKYFTQQFSDDLDKPSSKDATSRLTIARYYLEFMIPKQQTTTMRPETGKVDETTTELSEFDKEVLRILKTNPANGEAKD